MLRIFHTLRIQSIVFCFFLFTLTTFSQPTTALLFNGQDSYVNCGNNELLTPSGQITISAWINTNSEYIWQTILWRGDVVLNYYGIKITPEGKIRGTLFLDQFTHIFSGSSVKKNEWTHIAMTYDKNLLIKNYKLYINGNLESEISASGTIKYDYLPLLIGKYPWYGAGQIFSGLISNVQIWSRALSEIEIKEKMNVELDSTQEQGLSAYWKFDDGQESTLTDFSGNNLNGYIYNCLWYPVNNLEAKIGIDTTFWQDKDFNGFEAGTVDAESSIGNIKSYLWIMNDDTISASVKAIIEAPSGTNMLKLVVKDSSGFISSDSVQIDVYAGTLETNGRIYSAPSQLDSSLFISSYYDRVYSFDSSGSANWSYMTAGNSLSTIAVADKDNIFVSDSETRLYSFKDSGTPNWDKAMGGVIASSPAVSTKNKIIYTGLTSGRLFAVNYKGEVVWSYQAGESIVGSAVVDQGEVIYFGSKDKNLYAVDKFGKFLWKYGTDDVMISSPALGKDSSVIVNTTDGWLYKISSNGELIWKFSISDTPVMDFEVHPSPVIDHNGNIYVGSQDGYFYSISEDGSLNWKYNTYGEIKSTASISPDGNVIYFGNVKGDIFALTSSGELKWVLETNDAISAPTLVTESNLVYAGTLNGRVYIIKDIPYEQVTELPELQWPTFQGNNQRTGERSSILTHVDYSDPLPENYSLQNYPNPFNPSTRIHYSLIAEAKVQIRIYNSLGEIVRTFEPEVKSAGNYQVQWNAGVNASGIYFCTISAVPVNGESPFVKTIKMMLMK